MIPKLSLILNLTCRRYHTSSGPVPSRLSRAAFGLDGEDLCGGDNDVQAAASRFVLCIGLVESLLSSYASPRLCALSDRAGRKPILLLVGLGGVLTTSLLLATELSKTTSVGFLMVASVVEGFTGSILLAISISKSYVADRVPPGARNTAFGYLDACWTAGVASGPAITGILAKRSGGLIPIFTFLAAVYLLSLAVVQWAVSESLGEDQKLAARNRYQTGRARERDEIAWLVRLRRIQPLAALKILSSPETGLDAGQRRLLQSLAIVDTLGFSVGVCGTIISLYAHHKFGWGTAEMSFLVTVMNGVSALCLLVVLPLLQYLYQRRSDVEMLTRSGLRNYDLGILRASLFIGASAYAGLAFAPSGQVAVCCAAFTAVGAISTPIAHSAMTAIVPDDCVGEVLGALSFLYTMAKVLAPPLITAVYSVVVSTHAELAILAMATILFVAFALSLRLTGRTTTHGDE